MLCLTVEHPSGDGTRAVQAPIDGTPLALIEHLLDVNHSEGPFLKPPKNGGQYGLVLNRTGRSLDPKRPLPDQEVRDGDTLNVTLSASGAAPKVQRLQMDFASVQCLLHQNGCVDAFKAFTDATMKREVKTYEQSHLARFYLVRYGISLPINTKDRIANVVLSFDLSRVFESYPKSEVHDVRARNPIPWHHRIHKNGSFCTGGFRDENFLLGNNVVHLARMLNFDEPPGSVERDKGYRSEAAKWYQKTFNGPVNPNIKYPIINQRLLTRCQPDRRFSSRSQSPNKSSASRFSSKNRVSSVAS